MRILETAELEIKTTLTGWKLVTTTFLLFDIRTAVGPLEVYLQNLESLRSLRNLPAFEAEGFEAFEISRFFYEMPRRIRLRCLRSLREPEEAEKCIKRIHPRSKVTTQGYEPSLSTEPIFRCLNWSQKCTCKCQSKWVSDALLSSQVWAEEGNSGKQNLHWKSKKKMNCYPVKYGLKRETQENKVCTENPRRWTGCICLERLKSKKHYFIPSGNWEMKLWIESSKL